MFTGDVYDLGGDLGNPTRLIVIAHPCSIRTRGGQLSDTVLTARVRSHAKLPPHSWTNGHFARMPLPELTADAFHAAEFDEIDRVGTDDLRRGERIACLEEVGINLLQQRITWHLTRCEVPTSKFHEAFSHTYEEADLLEDWCETLSEMQIPTSEACARFEQFVRADRPGGRSLQLQLREPQRRPSVRNACREEARRQVTEHSAQQGRIVRSFDPEAANGPTADA